MALAGFAAMDANSEPPKPVFEKVLSKEEILEKEKAATEVQQFEQSIGGEMKMNIKVNNVLICTPCADSLNVLAIRGVFDIFIHFS